MQGRFVDKDMSRAVHGLEEEFLVLQVHGGVHVVAIVVEVARGLPKLGAGDGGVDEIVAVGGEVILERVFDEPAHDGALGQPVDEARAAFVVFWRKRPKRGPIRGGRAFWLPQGG